MHGSVKHKLSWSQSVDSVPFDPVLVLLAEVSDTYVVFMLQICQVVNHYVLIL